MALWSATGRGICATICSEKDEVVFLCVSHISHSLFRVRFRDTTHLLDFSCPRPHRHSRLLLGFFEGNGPTAEYLVAMLFELQLLLIV